MNENLIEFYPFLIEELRNPEIAFHYLHQAAEEGDDSFFAIALKDVLEAQCGIKTNTIALNRRRTLNILDEADNFRCGLEKVLGLLEINLPHKA